MRLFAAGDHVRTPASLRHIDTPFTASTQVTKPFWVKAVSCNNSPPALRARPPYSRRSFLPQKHQRASSSLMFPSAALLLALSSHGIEIFSSKPTWPASTRHMAVAFLCLLHMSPPARMCLFPGTPRNATDQFRFIQHPLLEPHRATLFPNKKPHY